MKIKKENLENTIKLLEILPLKKKASRMRTKFKNMLIVHYEELMSDIANIQKEYMVKDEETQEAIIENGMIRLSDPKQFQSEIRELINEEIVIIEDESNIDMLTSVKYSVLDCEIEFTQSEADNYDILCESFEQIKDK